MTYFDCIPRFLNYENTKTKKKYTRCVVGEQVDLVYQPTNTELKAEGVLPNDNFLERSTRSRQGYSSDDYT